MLRRNEYDMVPITRKRSIPNPPKQTTKRLKLDSDKKFVIDKRTAVNSIRNLVLKQNVVAFISPPNTGKTTILRHLAQPLGSPFAEVIMLNFKVVSGETPIAVLRRFAYAVARGFKWTLPAEINFTTLSALFASHKITKSTLILVDEYEIPFLAYYSSAKRSVPDDEVLFAIKTFYGELIEPHANKYVIMTGFTDFAVAEIQGNIDVYTFHNDAEIRPWFGVRKDEIEKFELDPKLREQIVKNCDEHYTFFKTPDQSYYLFHGVISSFVKNKLICGSTRSQHLFLDTNSIWKFIFHCPAASNLVLNILLREEVNAALIAPHEQFRIPHLYEESKSEKALLNLLIQCGILLNSDGAITLSNIFPNKDLESIVKRTVEIRVGQHNLRVHNYIEEHKYVELADFLSYEFSINLPCSEIHMLRGDRSWLNEMVYKCGLNFITERTGTFERVMQTESPFGKADMILFNEHKVICIEVKTITVEEALGTLKSNDFAEAVKDTLKKKSNEVAAQAKFKKYFRSVEPGTRILTSLVVVIIKDIVCLRVQNCTRGGTRRKVIVNYENEAQYYFPSASDEELFTAFEEMLKRKQASMMKKKKKKKLHSVVL